MLGSRKDMSQSPENTPTIRIVHIFLVPNYEHGCINNVSSQKQLPVKKHFLLIFSKNAELVAIIISSMVNSDNVCLQRGSVKVNSWLSLPGHALFIPKVEEC